VSQHDHRGRTRLYQSDGADAGDIAYSITLEGDKVVDGRVSSGSLVDTAPAVAETLVGTEPDRPLFLQLENGRWISLRIVNAAGELDRWGGVVPAPDWAEAST
jgi:hypothetical protein